MQPDPLYFDVPDPGQAGFTHRLVCWQWGKAERAVVCAHGLTRNGRDFDVLADTLCANRRVLCPDMPGRGKSDWPKNPAAYSYPSYIADIAFMLASLGLKRIDWIGTSMGGIIGMMLANSFPTLIRSLVLNDIGCLVPATGLRRILNYAGAPASFSTLAEAETALKERCAPFGITESWQWQQLFTHSFITHADGSIGFACDPAIAAAFPAKEAITDVNLWPLWEKIKTMPVLLIRGAQSDILPRSVAQEMQASHARLTLHEVPGAGHAPALMDKNQIDMIGKFLNGVA